MSSLVIGINYKTDEHAVRFARSLARYSAQDVSVVLVDNSERAGPGAFQRLIAEANPAVEYMQAPANLGYFGGANFGLKQFLGRSPLPEWVIVSNVDIEFRDPNFFAALGQLQSTENLGVVAPRIWSARWQRDLNPKIMQRPARRRMHFYNVVFGNYYSQTAYEILSFLKNGLRSQLRRQRGIAPQPQDGNPPAAHSTVIYAPHGSCMIFHQRYFSRGGSIEYPVFLFGEEIFVAETARRLGLLVAHCPQLWIYDNEHASTGIIRNRKIARYMTEATRYLVSNYFA